MKRYGIALILCLFIVGCGSDILPLVATSLTLRVTEKNGIFIVQRYDRLFLVGSWDNESKFDSREKAENYKNEWLENYRKFKLDKEKIY